MRAAGDRGPTARRDHHRDRRHGRRHRVAAVPRGGPPGAPGRRPRQRASSCTSRWCRTSRRPASSRPSRPSTRSPRCGRSASSPTRSSAAPTATIPAGDQAQDLADVRRRRRGRRRAPSTRRASTTSPRCCTPRASTRTSSAGSAWRSATSTGPTWDELLRRVHQPEHEVEVALVGKYVDLPDAYLSVTEALRAGGFDQDARVDCAGCLRRVRDAGGCAAGARRRRRRLHARRLRRPRHRGQGRRAALGAREPGPDARAVPRPAVHGHRVRPQRGRPGRRELAPSSTRDAAPGDRDDGGAEATSSRARATWAARCGSAPTRRSSPRARSSRERTAADGSRSGTGTATRSTTPTASELEEAGLVFSGTSPDGSLVEFVELPARGAPVLRVDAGAPRAQVAPEPGPPAVRRPGRRPRSPASARSGWSRSSPPRVRRVSAVARERGGAARPGRRPP